MRDARVKRRMTRTRPPRNREFGHLVTGRPLRGRGRKELAEADRRGIATRFRAFLKRHGIKDKEVAKRLGFDPLEITHLKTVRRWKSRSNPVPPELPMIMMICREFRISADELLFDRRDARGLAAIHGAEARSVLNAGLRHQLIAELAARRGYASEFLEARISSTSDFWGELVDLYDDRILRERPASKKRQTIPRRRPAARG